MLIRAYIYHCIILGTMQSALWFLAVSILVVTYLCESNELFTTKLVHRWYLFTLSVLSLHLWARGMSWKMSLLHIAAVLVVFKSDSSKPNPGAIFLLWYISISLVAVIVSFNPNRHNRQLWPPLHILRDDEDSIPHIDDNILEEVDFISSDSEEDDIEEHLPPNLFLEGPFLLGPPPPPVAAIAG